MPGTMSLWDTGNSNVNTQILEEFPAEVSPFEGIGMGHRAQAPTAEHHWSRGEEGGETLQPSQAHPSTTDSETRKEAQASRDMTSTLNTTQHWGST